MIAPCSVLACELDDVPVKSRPAPTPTSVFGYSLPSITVGSMEIEFSFPNFVSAFFVAWVVSCSTTVTTSPGRKARLSEVSDHGESTR